ncbi:serine protease DegS [Pseudidiomarina indica]|uniref:Serine protease DegS n=1 Tax=Pseudidiomarina indica TaxID=1159017 RepID=A0A1G6CHX9_9GAMM|nr:trypsin-like peptidase domain-containing protein [Pseudidiomarina indica]SDB32454.1 serine protease DegS [Pseudidiomarina indica]
MRLQHLLWYILRSVLLGLAVAAIVILVVPNAKQQLSPPVNLLQQPMSFATAVQRAAPAVVNIYSIGSIRGSYYSRRPTTVFRLGSGVIMDNLGHILTAYHVVAGVNEIQVALQDGRNYSGQVIGYDTVTDLAVVRIEADNLPVIPQNESLQSLVGDVVLAIGNPHNLGQTITQGIISATGGRMGIIHSHADLIQMDAAINEGASGGALINSQGYLVGINNAQFRDARGQGIDGIYFAVPYPLAKSVMDTLIREGEVVRGYLGVQVGDGPQTNHHNQPGIYVTGVDAGSPAEQAGLRADDYIIEIGGQPMQSATEGLAKVAQTKPGSTITVKFLRDNQLKTVDVVITRLQ